jgi:hypothetical protein
MQSAKIEEYPDYTFFVDGTAMNSKGQYVGHTVAEEDYVIATWKHTSGKRHKKRMHIMIMWAFSGEAPNGRDVDHINGIKDDNRYENLQYLDKITHNAKTRSDNPKRKPQRTKAIEGVSDDETVISFPSIAQAYEHFKVPPKSSGITRSIKTGIRFKGYRWKYVAKHIDNEIWKQPCIDGLDKEIFVSNYGRIKHKNGRISCGRKPNGGYRNVTVMVNGVAKNFKVHNLVCSAFHGKQPDWSSSVNHKNGNKLDNRVDNLEWSDPQSQAISWRVKIKLFNNNGDEQSFASIRDAANFLETSTSAISNVLSGKSKTVKGYTVERHGPKRKQTKKRGQIMNGGIHVLQFDYAGKELIKEFPSIDSIVTNMFPNIDTSKKSGKRATIRYALISGHRAYGHYWRFKNPPENLTELKETERQRQLNKNINKRTSKRVVVTNDNVS